MNEEFSTAYGLTRELVRIDSSDPGAYEGNICGFVKGWLEERGLAVTVSEVLPGRSNLLCRIPGESSGPSLTYICHMDTVALGDGWGRDPLGAEVSDGRIYGRGACDMKSGLACAMSAFAAVAESGRKPKHTFQLIATVDEEDFMRGVEQTIRDNWVTSTDWVLDTEPTNGQIQVAHKGRTWFEVSIQGVTAHASTPWKGADAIAAMAEVITRIRSQVNGLPPHPDLGVSTVTFGQIEGGYRPYVVPDSCRVWIDMRLVPPTDTSAAEAIVAGALRAACREVPGCQGSYQITGDRPYVEKDENSHLLHALSETCRHVIGEAPIVSYFPGYTDTAVIAGTLSNRTCMSYGPGDLELVHKPDESVPISDIVRCEKVLKALAERMIFED